MATRRWLLILSAATVSLAGGPVRGEAQDDKNKGAGLWNIDIMVEQAAKQIISRYKLNDEQAKATRDIMARRVNQLLDKHDDAIRQLFREAAAMRIAGKPPSAETIKSWAERAIPVYQEARKQILEGNEEWGKILTPAQKKIHDLDLKMMQQDFAQYEERLTRWSKGGFDPAKDWVVSTPPARKPMPRRSDWKERAAKNGQHPSQAGGASPAPPAQQPPQGGGSAQQPPTGPSRFGYDKGQQSANSAQQPTTDVEMDPEHFWDAYVRDFVRKYRLDAAQEGQAMAILKDCKARARRHRDAHVEDYKRLHANLRQLRSSGVTGEALTRVSEELRDLDAPVSDIFEELKGRLESIPTSAQLRQYEEGRQRREQQSSEKSK